MMQSFKSMSSCRVLLSSSRAFSSGGWAGLAASTPSSTRATVGLLASGHGASDVSSPHTPRGARRIAAASRVVAPSSTPASRSYSTSSSPSASKIVPISQEYPGIPSLKPAGNLPAPSTQVTTLPNGLTVASQETYGQVATVGMYVAAGSMFEKPELYGVVHLLETLAFKSTETMSVEEIMQFNTMKGIATGAVANRETINFKVDCLRGSTQDAVRLLGDALLRPAFTPDELREAKEIIQYQAMDALQDTGMLLLNLLQTAAYGEDTPLGHSPLLTNPEKLQELNEGHIREFMASHFRPSRMVLSGAGVSHDELVAYANETFGDVVEPDTPPPPVPVSPYIGGDVRVPGIEGVESENAIVSVAFPCAGWSSDDIVPCCVLDMLLGGGSSFSAGGPGKGMYTRLYREVLNSFSWVDATNSFVMQHTSCGLIGISGTCPKSFAIGMLELVCAHLGRLAEHQVTPVELSRAKNMLRSSVMMNLESRLILCDDIGQQMVSSGMRVSEADLCDRIDAVTADDLQRIAREFVSQKPSVAILGDVPPSMPPYSVIEEYFQTVSSNASSSEGSSTP